MESTFQQHEYREGESFDYLYESTEATFATEQFADGRVAHITDLVKIFESRTKVRFTTVSDAGKLRKQVEFSDTRFREITTENLQRHEQVPFRSGQDIVPGLPDVLAHTYDLGTDGRVASGLGVIFDQYLAGTDFRGPYRFIDAFTFAAVIEKFTEPMSVGDVSIRPATDYEFYGATYHSAQQYLYFDRIDMVDGVHQAFLKVHALGNYTDPARGDSSYLISAHFPLEGPATGLVSRGELHEIIFEGTDPSIPVAATQRQLSMTLQTDHARSEALRSS